MKSNIASLTVLLFSGTLMLSACDSNTSNKMESKMDTLANKVDTLANKAEDKVEDMTSKKRDDVDFVSDAVEANTNEIHALELGRQMGGKDVKMHAAHMLADHKKMGKQMADYAASKNMTLKDVDTVDNSGMKNDKPGMDWDKNWADKMVDDHEKVVKMFEDSENDVQDPELKKMITGALPTLRSHLEMSKKLQDQLKK